LDEPVEFGEMGNPDGKVNVRIACMLAVTQSEALISLLRHLAEMFQNPDTLQRIVEAADAAEVAAIFNNQLSDFREE